MKCSMLALILSAVALLPDGPLRAADDDDAFFEKQVRPLLVKRCYKCHSGAKTNGGLALDSRVGWQKGGDSGAVIVPGKPESSPLIQAINYQSLEMPPEDGGGKLSDAEIAVLTKWVKLGAPDPREEAVRPDGMSEAAAKSWWAFQPLRASAAVATSKQVDRLIDAELARRSLTPSPPSWPHWWSPHLRPSAVCS